MYPPQMVAPMKEDLTNVGFQSLETAADVDNFMANASGISMVVVNSVCGCAAGAARPGIKGALAYSEVKPDNLATVFAGVDTEAVAKMREYMLPYPPSSPCIAIFRDDELVHFIERHHIEGRNAQMIGEHLVSAFEEFCEKA
ncbi:MAG: BrxA/BrxB family bacilliredoxin [Runella slithyformis]|jgi:putative YphP/YqiW family bacilliredoxin|nr:MAG: BrxA/BrxB family bacilliredoxin [Runella slithyformis]TAG17006.1 MAG: BrxA/BrxB family bacilliredoxin [Cytophagales bacterium]TAG36141.1 MAG: BrxA/BrxB family bacilliredoxin [Cytophagia bacterium]TAF28133.1 MAG: BrxA/BrxB family bacilliredoxin [Runella slithyformis]TAF46737.1 MAG: BrxA/BrxB family bacilliredoxin [Runella slithyformis]